MNMDINLNDIIAKLRALDRRVQIALIAGALLLLYYVVLGMQISGEVRRNNDFLLQQQTLMRTINLANRLGPAPEAELQAVEARMEETMAGLTFDHVEELYPMLAAVASRSRVTIQGSIGIAAAGTQTREGLTYEMRRVTVRVIGSLANIRRFIEEMSATTAAAVTSIALNTTSQPYSATIDMSLFLNPK